MVILRGPLPERDPGKRDKKYTYRLDNGSYYVGVDAPVGVEP